MCILQLMMILEFDNARFENSGCELAAEPDSCTLDRLLMRMLADADITCCAIVLWRTCHTIRTVHNAQQCEMTYKVLHA